MNSPDLLMKGRTQYPWHLPFSGTNPYFPVAFRGREGLLGPLGSFSHFRGNEGPTASPQAECERRSLLNELAARASYFQEAVL